MKKIKNILGLICLVNLSATAQNNIGIGTLTPDTSAKLEVSSSTQGFLLPRMTTTQVTAIALPAKGLLVYNTTLNQTQVNIGTTTAPTWIITSGQTDNLGNHTATQNLNLNGNSITTAGVNTGATGVVTLSGNSYPTTSGIKEQVLTTNGAGTLTFKPLENPGNRVVLHVQRPDGTGGNTVPIGNNTYNGALQLNFTEDIVSPNTTNNKSIGTWGLDSNVKFTTGGSPFTYFSRKVYTVAEAGYYLITAGVAVNNASMQNVVPLLSVHVANAAGDQKYVHYGNGGSNALNLPKYTTGRSELCTMVKLEVGDKVGVIASNTSSNVAGTGELYATTYGSPAHLLIMKLN